MHKSRLFEVFSALNQQNIKELKKFVASPFVNQREHVILLYSFLVREKKRGQQSPDRREAFAFIWPNLPYDDHKLRLSMSLLLKAIEQYLVWQKTNEDQVNVKLKLSQAYRQLGLNRHFVKTITEVQSMQQRQALRHAEYYQNRYSFYLEQYHFNAEQNRMEGLQLEEVQENLDISYLASKLRQSCLILSHQAIYKKEYDFGMLNAVINYIEDHAYLQHPAISIYYHVYKALTTEGDNDHFSQFKALIFAHQEQFPKDEIRDLFLLAANYCIKQLNRGRHHFAKEGLEIYKEGLKNDILLRNGVLSNFTYSNIVAKAIVTKDFQWAAQFVHEYKTKLEPKHQENSYSFNLAWLEYEQKNYNQALTLLNKTNFTDLLLNIAAKTIAMKIYYELDAFDLLSSHLDAMHIFLHRKKILASHKKNYLNTIKYLRKIIDLPLADRQKRPQLQEEISNVAIIAEKKWLLRQLE